MALVLLLEGAVVVRRLRGELTGAGIHQFVHAFDAELVPLLVDLALQATEQVRDLAVGVAFLFGFEEQVAGNGIERVLLPISFSVRIMSSICFRNQMSMR
jgi:hypothetical protein